MTIAHWRRDRLTAPDTAILQRAIALMSGTVAPHLTHVHAALKFAVVEDAHTHAGSPTSAAQNSSTRDREIWDGMVADVAATYTRAVRDFAFAGLKSGQDFAWWMAGMNAPVIAKRSKAIQRFMDAAIEKAAELEKADETFTYRAAISNYSAIIEKFKVVDETKAMVSYFREPEGGEMVTERKDAQTHSHFATWAEAHLFLKAYSAQKLADARRALEIAQSYDGNVRGMKEHSRKKIRTQAIETPETLAETAKAVIEVTHANIAATQPGQMTDAELAAAVPA